MYQGSGKSREELKGEGVMGMAAPIPPMEPFRLGGEDEVLQWDGDSFRAMGVPEVYFNHGEYIDLKDEWYRRHAGLSGIITIPQDTSGSAWSKIARIASFLFPPITQGHARQVSEFETLEQRVAARERRER